MIGRYLARQPLRSTTLGNRRRAHRSPLKKALLTGFHSTAKHNAKKAWSCAVLRDDDDHLSDQFRPPAGAISHANTGPLSALSTVCCGVPAPISLLRCPETADCGRRHGAGDRLCTFSRPLSAIYRRMPPRSRLCAKERSTISARSLKASLATPDNSRVPVPLTSTARRAAPSP